MYHLETEKLFFVKYLGIQLRNVCARRKNNKNHITRINKLLRLNIQKNALLKYTSYYVETIK